MISLNDFLKDKRNEKHLKKWHKKDWHASEHDCEERYQNAAANLLAGKEKTTGRPYKAIIKNRTSWFYMMLWWMHYEALSEYRKASMFVLEKAKWHRVNFQTSVSNGTNTAVQATIDGKAIIFDLVRGTANELIYTVEYDAQKTPFIQKARVNPSGGPAKNLQLKPSGEASFKLKIPRTHLPEPDSLCKLSIELCCWPVKPTKQRKIVYVNEMLSQDGQESDEMDPLDPTETFELEEDKIAVLSPPSQVDEKIKQRLHELGISKLTERHRQFVLKVCNDEPLDWFRDICDNIRKNTGNANSAKNFCEVLHTSTGNPFAACVDSNERVFASAGDQVLLLRHQNLDNDSVRFVVKSEFSNVAEVVGLLLEPPFQVGLNGQLSFPLGSVSYSAKIEKANGGVVLVFDKAALPALKDPASRVEITFNAWEGNWFVPHLGIPKPGQAQDVAEQWRPPDLEAWVDEATRNATSKKRTLTPRMALKFVFDKYCEECGFRLSREEKEIGLCFHMDRMEVAEIAGLLPHASLKAVEACIVKLQDGPYKYLVYRHNVRMPGEVMREVRDKGKAINP